MGFSLTEYAAKKKKEDKTATKFSLADYEYKKVSEDILAGKQTDVDKNYDNLMSGIVSIGDKIEEEKSNFSSGYIDRATANIYATNAKLGLDSLLSQAQRAQSHYTRYGSLYDQVYGEGAAQKLLDNVNSVIDWLEPELNFTNTFQEYWNQFNSEVDYNYYGIIPLSDDFNEKSQYTSKYIGGEKKNITNGVYHETGYANDDDLLYGYINGEEVATKVTKAYELDSTLLVGGFSQQHLRLMTEDDKAIFNYLYETQGAAAAKEFINHIDGSLKAVQRANEMQSWSQYATEHPIMASIGSVITSPLKGLSYLGQAVDYITTGEIDENAAYNRYSYIPSTIRGTVSNMIQDTWAGEVGSYVYNLGMSMGEFVFSTAITGGNPTATMAILGAGAAADATLAAKERGLSDGQAIALGTLAGIIEAGTEKIGLDALFGKLGNKLAGAGKVAYWFGNIGAEAAEEGLATSLNWAADALIAQDKSEWNMAIDKYIAQGMTKSEAIAQTVLDHAGELGLDVLGGAISGGTIAGGTLGVNSASSAISNYNEISSIGEEFLENPSGVEWSTEQLGSDWSYACRVLEEGLKADSSSEFYKIAQDIKNKLDKGKASSVTNYELGKLFAAYAEVGNAQSVDAISAYLENAGANTATANSVAPALYSIFLGESISGNQASLIATTPAAIDYLNQTFGVQIDTNTSLSKLKAEIKKLSNPDYRQRVAENSANNSIGESYQSEIEGAVLGQNSASVGNSVNIDNKIRLTKYANNINLGENGRQTMMSLYDDSYDFIGFAGAFTAYYQAGVAGTPISAVKSNLSYAVSDNVKAMAYNAGQMDALRSDRNNGQRTPNSTAQANSTLPNGENSDTINDNYDENLDFEVIDDGEEQQSDRGNESSGRNGKRTHRVVARKSGVSVRGRTAKAQAGSETQKRRAESIKNNVNAQGVERVATASQGISIGTDNPTLQVVPHNLYTEEMKAVSKEQFDKGRRVIFFVGQLEMSENGETFTARGALSKDGERIWIQADHPSLTIEQIAKHEEFHALIKKDAGLLDRTRRQVIAKHGEAQLQELVESYVNEYGWTDLSDEYILEEILADAYAEIDVFDYLTDYEGATRFSDTVQESAKSVQGTSSGIENDTGQEQFSRSKNKFSSVRERKIFERQRQDQMRRYMRENNEVLPEEWCSFGEDYFYVYKNYSFTEYRITRRIEITQDKNPLIQEIEREFYYGDKVEQSREISNKMAEGFRSSKNASDWHNVDAAEAGGAGRVHGVDGDSSRSDSSGIDKEGSGNLNGRRTSGLTEKFSRSTPNTTITQENIRELRSIGRKSVNAFTAEDIKKAEPFARRAWQELGVKSPFFRAWFGDWRINDISPVQIANKRGDSRGLVNNTDTGWSIQVSGKVFNETTAHTDSYNIAARQYLPYINDIVSKAVLLDSYSFDTNKTKSINSLFMHSLYVVADIGNGPEILKLYVEEMNNPNTTNTGKRAYQLQNIKKYRSTGKSSQKSVSSISPATDMVKTVADLFELVKQKDKNFNTKPVNPILLNEDGTPKKFYHGTNEQFTAFSPDEFASREGSFFFAENREDAAAYGDNIFEVYLTGSKLADYDNQPSEFYRLKDKREQVEWLKKRGYDGWYSDMDSGGWGEVSVFNPTQIKSAADNIGTFDGNNSDIRFSRETPNYLQEENERIHKELQDIKRKYREKQKQKDYWKDEATRAPILDRDDVKAVTENLLSSYSSKADKTATFNALKKLGEFIIRGGNKTADLEWGVVKEKAVDIARNILENASELADDGNRATYKEIRNYLRTTKLHVTQSLKNEIGYLSDDFNTFRKRNMGRLSLSFAEGIGVDTAYQELQSKYGTALFPDTITNDADQLMHLAELVPTLQDVYENPYSYDMAEAIELCAYDIIEQLMSEDVRQKETRTTQQNRKLIEAKAKLGKLRAEKNARIEAIKQHYRDVAQKQRVRKAESKARERLLHIVRRLNNKKLPVVQRGLLGQYLGEIDTVAVSITGKTVRNLIKLYDWYMNEQETDPDFLGDERTEKMLRRLSQRQIEEMTIEEVSGLTEVLLGIENRIRTRRKLIDSQERRDVYLAGAQTIENIKNTRPEPQGKLSKFFGDTIVTQTLTPVRMAERLTGYNESDPLYIAVKELNEGQLRKHDYQMKRYQEFRKWTENKQFIKYITGKNAQEITVTAHSGDKAVSVKITPAMRMSLYSHSLNRQNMRHIQYGGVTIPDMALYKKGKIDEAYNRGETVYFTKSEIAKMAESMTDIEKEFAVAVHKYFNKTSPEAINETSEKLVGYSIAMLENYFPVDVDTSFTRADFTSVKYDGSIEGMGFLKERVNSSAPIYLRDINDVLLKAIEQHSMYVGMAIPIRNFNKLWGVTKRSFSEDGTRLNIEGSVQKAVKKHWGKQAYQYIEKMMTDIANPRKEQDPWSMLFTQLRGTYASAVIALNVSPALKQFASYITAGSILGFEALAKTAADFHKVDVELINKYTPLLWLRSQGYSTVELGDIKDNGNAVSKLLSKKALNWNQSVDVLVAKRLWVASEYYIKKQNSDLKVGTDEYYKAVAELFNRVIEETQTNHSLMQRPQISRSNNPIVRDLTMFKTDAFQIFNILYNDYGRLVAKKRAYTNLGTEQSKLELKEAKSKVAKSSVSVLMTFTFVAAITLAWSVFRGKDDEYENEEGERTFGSVMLGMGKDVFSSYASIVPLGDTVAEMINSLVWDDEFYGVSSISNSAFLNLIDAIFDVGDTIKSMVEESKEGGIDWNDRRFDLENITVAFSKTFGVPTDSVQKLVGATFRVGAKVATGSRIKGDYIYLKLSTSPKDYSSDYYNLLFEAYKKKDGSYEDIVADMLESEYFTEDKIRSAMDARLKEEQGVTSTEDMEYRYLFPDEQERYDDILDDVDDSALWDDADAEQRTYTRNLIYQLVAQTSTPNSAGSEMQDKIDRSGITEDNYILYKLALKLADADGNGYITSKERAAAIDMLKMGRSDSSALWDVESTNKNPYK